MADWYAVQSQVLLFDLFVSIIMGVSTKVNRKFENIFESDGIKSKLSAEVYGKTASI